MNDMRLMIGDKSCDFKEVYDLVMKAGGSPSLEKFKIALPLLCWCDHHHTFFSHSF